MRSRGAGVAPAVAVTSLPWGDQPGRVYPRPPPGPGARAFASVQRRVRSTAVTVWGKRLYSHECQVCGETVRTAAGPYAEGADLQPVGSPDNGPDAIENVLCLCPNDHVRADRGAIGFDDQWNVIDLGSDTVIGKVRVHPNHPLDPVYAQHHRAMF